MASTSSSSPVLTKFNLKLLIDNGASKVLYAEVGKDFVDFLFSLLLLPMASVVRVLTKDGIAGSLGELYGSLESFSSTHLLPNLDRVFILRPVPSYSIGQKTLAMMRYDGLPTSVGTTSSGGFVKDGEITYMVTDDLAVSPLSTSAIVAQLKNSSGGATLVEKNVLFGAEEGIKLIRASLVSKTVLSDVFAKTNISGPTPSFGFGSMMR